MKIEITKAQPKAIKDMTDDISSMIGCSDDDTDLAWKKYVKMVDNMLKNNGLKPRDYK